MGAIVGRMYLVLSLKQCRQILDSGSQELDIVGLCLIHGSKVGDMRPDNDNSLLQKGKFR